MNKYVYILLSYVIMINVSKYLVELAVTTICNIGVSHLLFIQTCALQCFCGVKQT